MITPTPAPPEADYSVDRLFSFTTSQACLRKLVSEHEGVTVKETDKRRRLRKIEVNIDDLQQRGLLKSDETLIPIRVIDTNIRREQPNLVAFFTQSHRAAIFKPRTQNFNPVNLEKAFTDGVRYTGWELPFYGCIDGGQLHGRDAVEVEYDETKPFKVGIAHIGHENLVIPKGVHNLEHCERILVRYPKQTIYSLKTKVKDFGFDPVQIEQLIGDKDESTYEEASYTIYKTLFKFNGIVYVGWFSTEGQCNDWLKAPEPLWMGRMTVEESVEVQMVTDPVTFMAAPMEVPVKKEVKQYESVYPIKLYIYKLTEEKELDAKRGRAFEDESKQTAQVSLWSSYINGVVRASNVYASPDQDSSDGASLAQLEVALEHGRMYNKKVNFWHTDYPPMSVIDSAGRLDTANQNETGQVAYSVLTRKDTEKTAKEITSAENQSNLLSTVQVTLLASFFRDVYAHVWLVVQSLAIQGKIVLKNVPPEEIVELYEVESAGSTDVIERDQKMQRRMNAWAIISQTPLAQAFLIDILRELFPQDAKRYESILVANDPKKAVIQGAMGIIQALVMGDDGKIKPEFAQHEAMITQFAQQAAAVQQQQL